MPQQMPAPGGIGLDVQGLVHHVDHADQHRGLPGAGLADHVEHGIAQALIAGATAMQYDSPVTQQHGRGQVPPRQAAQRGTQSVQHSDRSEGVVDAGR